MCQFRVHDTGEISWQHAEMALKCQQEATLQVFFLGAPAKRVTHLQFRSEHSGPTERERKQSGRRGRGGLNWRHQVGSPRCRAVTLNNCLRGRGGTLREERKWSEQAPGWGASRSQERSGFFRLADRVKRGQMRWFGVGAAMGRYPGAWPKVTL